MRDNRDLFAGDKRRSVSHRYGLYRNFHTIKSVCFPFPTAGERGCFFVLAGHCNGYMLVAGGFVVRGIEPAPAHAGDVDLRPGVGGAVLAFAHSDVAGNKSRPKTPMAGGLHHEHREVAAGSGTQKERLGKEAGPRLPRGERI